MVEKRHLEILVKQQEEIDTHQLPEDQDTHAMTVGYTHDAAAKTPVYSDKKGDMIERANDFVGASLDAAVRSYQDGNAEEAFKHVGNAIHTVQDATSPEHEGFKIVHNREQLGEGKASKRAGQSS